MQETSMAESHGTSHMTRPLIHGTFLCFSFQLSFQPSNSDPSAVFVSLVFYFILFLYLKMVGLEYL